MAKVKGIYSSMWRQTLRNSNLKYKLILHGCTLNYAYRSSVCHLICMKIREIQNMCYNLFPPLADATHATACLNSPIPSNQSIRATLELNKISRLQKPYCLAIMRPYRFHKIKVPLNKPLLNYLPYTHCTLFVVHGFQVVNWSLKSSFNVFFKLPFSQVVACY